MATIKEIAQKAGVSIGTVDRVIHNRGRVNAETKALIHAVMEELNYQPNLAAKGLAVRKKKLKLCMILPDVYGHPYYADVKIAAEQKANELKQYGVDVLFETLSYTDDNESGGYGFKKDERILSVLEQVDGLSIFGIDEPFINLILDKAESLGLPVVYYTTAPLDRDYLAYVGCDYVKSGRLAAGLAALSGGNNAQVCIYSEDVVRVSSHEDRVQGFCQELADKYPAMKLLDIRNISIVQQDILPSVREMLEKWPDVNVVYVVNPGNYRICEAIYELDKTHKIHIITNDLVEGQRDMIEEGIISATICQEPDQQGALPLEILFKYLAYDIRPENRDHYTKLSIHIAQSLY